MIAPSVGALVLVLTLAAFVGLGLRARRNRDLDEFVSARNSQGPQVLGLSFLAAGMGAWILFAPPEVGAGVGLLGVAGYAIGAAVPIVLFAVLGARIRKAMPQGQSLGEFARLRFGRAFSTWVFVISVAYMSIFVTAELTGVAGVTGIIAGVDPRVTVIAVVMATLAYTALGGLRASLITDRWQALLIIGLLAIGFVAIAGSTDDVGTAFTGSGLLGVNRIGIEVALTLIIAVTAANMFHQGYWQRVWAAEDDAALRRGAWIGAGLTVPVILLVGVLGVIATGSGSGLDVSPVPFFALTGALGPAVGVIVLVLGVALVASSVDTLETGLLSLVAAEVPGMKLSGARVGTIALIVPAAIVAFQGFSVLRLFLIADLLCAGLVMPLLSGLWSRATNLGALAGAVAGLVGAVLPHLVTTGSLAGALEVASFPGAVPTLSPFAGALGCSTVVTLVVSALGRRTTEVTDLGSPPLAPITKPSVG